MEETHPPVAAAVVIDDPHAPHDDAHHVAQHVKKYLIVGGVLLAFTALTVFLSYVDFGNHKANMAVGMLVAAFKAGLVAGIFMHLSSERKLIYRILMFTAVFVFALFWLTYLHWYNPIAR